MTPLDHAKPNTARGAVVESLPNAGFTVALADGRTIRATLSGKLRTRHTRITPGDSVIVALSPWDRTRGNVIGRERGGAAHGGGE